MGPPDKFHENAHPGAREITGPLQYGEWGQCVAESKQNDRRCHGHARGPHGKCNTHGGADGSGAKEGNQNAVGNEGGDGAEEGNDHAEVHGAFSKHFRSSLTKEEKEAFKDAYKRLEDPEGAQDVAREVAVDFIMKYQRSGDERFGRRFESICDKAGIFPADEVDVNHSDLSTIIAEDSE